MIGIYRLLLASIHQDSFVKCLPVMARVRTLTLCCYADCQTTHCLDQSPHSRDPDAGRYVKSTKFKLLREARTVL